jgi:two-component system, OmpR family, phosphate regulon sensor histidine kinase PhoR
MDHGAVLAVLEAFPDGLIVTDSGGRIEWVNQRFTEIFQFSAEFAQGRSISMLLGPYAQQDEGQGLSELVRTGSGSLELTAFTRDGIPFPCLLRIRTPGNGSTARVVVASDQSDVQQLRIELVLKAEVALKEREILRATAQALEDAVLVVDDAERLVLANASGRELFGLGSGEILGRSLTEIPLPPTVRGAWLAFLASGRKASTQTVRVAIGTQARTFLLRLARAHSARGVPLASMLVVRDLTRLAAPDRRKYDFITQLSHEMRTPLASIQGFAETLAGEPDLESDLRVEFCQIIQGETQRLSTLVENLLEMAQLDSGKLVLDRRTMDIAPLIRDTAARFADNARAAGGSIVLDLPPEPVPVWADPARIEQMLVQLLCNALRHGATDRGIKVTVRTEADRVELDVRDWGPAVPPEDLERVFDPFYRVVEPAVAAADGENGLGLALCRQIVERHGGSIRAELPAEGGLRISVELKAA